MCPPVLAAVPLPHLHELEVRHARLHPLGRVLDRVHLAAGDLRADHRGALDPAERLLHPGEPVVDDRLVAVDREAHRPASEAELRADALDRLLGEDALPLVPVRPVGEHRRRGDGAQDHRIAGDRAAEHQLAHDVHHRPEVVVARHHHPARQVALRLRHQPDAHLGDDAEVRLEEEAVERRPEAPPVHVPGSAVRDGAHARAHQLAVREHHLQPARVGGVIAVGRVAEAVLQGVADHAAPPEIGHGDPQLVARRAHRLVQVEEAHARLDDRIGGVAVDLEHAVHPPQVHDDGPAHARRRAAVAVVPALRAHPERDAVVVRDPHDRLELLDRLGLHDGGGLVVVPPREPVGVAELPQLLDVGEHVLRADGRAEAVESRVECLLGQVGGEHARHR